MTYVKFVKHIVAVPKTCRNHFLLRKAEVFLKKSTVSDEGSIRY
jgi:hypothetical protein